MLLCKTETFRLGTGSPTVFLFTCMCSKVKDPANWRGLQNGKVESWWEKNNWMTFVRPLNRFNPDLRWSAAVVGGGEGEHGC